MSHQPSSQTSSTSRTSKKLETTSYASKLLGIPDNFVAIAASVMNDQEVLIALSVPRETSFFHKRFFGDKPKWTERYCLKPYFIKEKTQRNCPYAPFIKYEEGDKIKHYNIKETGGSKGHLTLEAVDLRIPLGHLNHLLKLKEISIKRDGHYLKITYLEKNETVYLNLKKTSNTSLLTKLNQSQDIKTFLDNHEDEMVSIYHDDKKTPLKVAAIHDKDANVTCTIIRDLDLHAYGSKQPIDNKTRQNTSRRGERIQLKANLINAGKITKNAPMDIVDKGTITLDEHLFLRKLNNALMSNIATLIKRPFPHAFTNNYINDDQKAFPRVQQSKTKIGVIIKGQMIPFIMADRILACYQLLKWEGYQFNMNPTWSEQWKKMSPDGKFKAINAVLPRMEKVITSFSKRTIQAYAKIKQDKEDASHTTKNRERRPSPHEAYQENRSIARRNSASSSDSKIFPTATNEMPSQIRPSSAYQRNRSNSQGSNIFFAHRPNTPPTKEPDRTKIKKGTRR
jgi:hypothetical protein